MCWKKNLMIGAVLIATTLPAQTPKLSNALRSGDALKIGINGFHWVPADRLQPFAYYREYQMWQWMEGSEKQNRFDPSDQADARYDAHYADLKARGIMPIACVNTTPSWLTNGYPFNYHVQDYRPIYPWEDPLDPRSYDEFARFLWQLTARYGRVVHPLSALSINQQPRWTNDTPNQPRTGLDLLSFIEVWNEPDKWWAKPSNAYFEPEHYAAMLSACYDGHEGALGPGYGIKTADPSMQVVMAGLSNFDQPYLQRMLKWFQMNRKDKRFPADVINFHHYSNLNSGLYQAFVNGVSPEQDRLKESLRTMIDFCRQNVPGKSFWFSEFGYDTWQGSPQRSVPTTYFNAVDVQGMWLQRTYLEAIAAGVDLCFAYNICDEVNSNYLFGSSGLLLSERQGFAKKDSWQKMKALADRLNGLSFQEDLSPDNSVRIYRFKGTDGKSTLVAWTVGTENITVPFPAAPYGQLYLTSWPKFIPL